MSLKTLYQERINNDAEMLRERERVAYKRDAARALVPILRLLGEKRWAEASVEIDEYLKVKPPYGNPYAESRKAYLRSAMETRWPTSWRSMFDAIETGRKFVAMQLEKDRARANAEAQIRSVRTFLMDGH